MKLAILSAAFLAGAVALAACTIDGNALAPIVGQRNAQVLSAGLRSFNATQLNDKDEDAIGQSVGLVLTNRYALVRSDDVQRYVNLVGLTVANRSANPGGNWIFGVLDTHDVNAFSGPNGYVFITRALTHMQDEAALAGVLAHEIAHCSNHDGLKGIQAAEQRQALNDFMKAADSRTAQLAVFSDFGADFITKTGYDQPTEFKADEDGTRLMYAADYDPASYLAFLRNVQASSGSASGGQLMSTHPGIAQRIARVDAAIRGLPRTGPTNGATLKARFDLNMQRGGIK